MNNLTARAALAARTALRADAALRAETARWNPTADPLVVIGFLRDLGYLPPEPGGAAELPADWLGALRLFQAVAGLEVDGVAGPRTVHALARAHRAWLDARAFAA